jgi:hypothetical protein
VHIGLDDRTAHVSSKQASQQMRATCAGLKHASLYRKSGELSVPQLGALTRRDSREAHTAQLCCVVRTTVALEHCHKQLCGACCI